MEERRRFRRYPLYCPLEFKPEGEERQDSSITINFSEGGALISTARPVKPDANLIVKISFKNEIFFLRGRVVHVQHEEDKGVYHVGIEFLQMPVNFIRKFYEELEVIMFYQVQCSTETGRPVSLAEASIKWYGASLGLA